MTTVPTMPAEPDLAWLATDPAPGRPLLDPAAEQPILYGDYGRIPPVMPGAARHAVELAAITARFRDAIRARMRYEHGLELVRFPVPGPPAAAFRRLGYAGAAAEHMRVAHNAARPPEILEDDDDYAAPSFTAAGIGRGSVVDAYLGPFPHPDPTPTVVGWSHGRGAVGEWAAAAAHAEWRRQTGSRTQRKYSRRDRDALQPAAAAEWALTAAQTAAWVQQARGHIATAEQAAAAAESDAIAALATAPRPRTAVNLK